MPALLERLGPRVQATPTTAPGDATRFAQEAAEAGSEVVYVLGGDGTVREAAAGLLGSPTALGVLPGGTTNVVAGALGLPARSAMAAAARLREAHRVEIDVGRCGDEIFLMQASAGIDAATMARVPILLKRHAGRLGVGLAGLGEISTYGYPEIDLQLDGRPIQGATLAAIVNLAAYAGSFRIVPDASCRDRRLDALIFRGRGRIATLSFFYDLARGRHHLRPDVQILPVERARFAGGAPFQLDGDAFLSEDERRVELAEDRLTVLAPEPLPAGL